MSHPIESLTAALATPVKPVAHYSLKKVGAVIDTTILKTANIRKPASKTGTVLVNLVHSTHIGAWPSGKAAGFGPVIRRFESYRPS